MSAVAAHGSAGWRARLELGLAARAGRTVLVHRRHDGPLVVQRPFYPEGVVCHLYLLHPPGGIVGGDRLELVLSCAAGSHALVTTPAVGKFYRSAGPTAVQRQRLKVAAGAALEWLPQEQIAFEGARADSLTQVRLAPGAAFIGWELNCLGRPASGEGFAHGALRTRFELWREGRPLLLERTLVAGGSRWLHAAYGAGGASVLGTLAAVGADDAHVERARAALAADAPAAVTRLGEVLVARYRGHSAEQARACFVRIWAALRPSLLGRPACEPRIWRT